MITLTPSGGDDTAQIQAALASEKIVRLSEGAFFATGSLAISQQATKLRGEGETATTLTITTPDQPGLVFSTWLSDIEIGGFTLDRSATAVDGANGIFAAEFPCNRVRLHDLRIRHHFNGLCLGTTAWSQVENVITERNQYDGLSMRNYPSDGAMQWGLRHVLSQFNASRGFFVQTVPGPAGGIMGAWDDVATFANSGVGVAFVGSEECPLFDIRIRSGFFGGDGNHELFLDTYGGQHLLSDVFVELAGKKPTGPAYDTPPSGKGHGILVTANNGTIQMANVRSSANSQRGLHAAAGGLLHVVGMTAQSNAGGSYRLGSADQMLRECRDNAGALVNAAGPTTIA